MTLKNAERHLTTKYCRLANIIINPNRVDRGLLSASTLYMAHPLFNILVTTTYKNYLITY